MIVIYGADWQRATILLQVACLLLSDPSGKVRSAAALHSVSQCTLPAIFYTGVDVWKKTFSTFTRNAPGHCHPAPDEPMSKPSSLETDSHHTKACKELPEIYADC